jgi:hypothetical protein
MSSRLPAELVREAREAFVDYETVYVTRVAKRPGGRLDAQRLEDVLATADEAKVRTFVEQLRMARQSLLDGVII